MNLSHYLILIGSHRRHKVTSPPKLSSAVELTDGSSLRPHRPGNHQEDSTGVAHPSPPSGPREELPVAGDDRRCLTSVRAEEEGEGIDWSNLTSGPSGPTASDPVPVHVGLSEDVIRLVRFPRSESVFPSETFSFLF